MRGPPRQQPRAQPEQPDQPHRHHAGGLHDRQHRGGILPLARVEPEARQQHLIDHAHADRALTGFRQRQPQVQRPVVQAGEVTHDRPARRADHHARGVQVLLLLFVPLHLVTHRVEQAVDLILLARQKVPARLAARPVVRFHHRLFLRPRQRRRLAGVEAHHDHVVVLAGAVRRHAEQPLDQLDQHLVAQVRALEVDRHQHVRTVLAELAHRHRVAFLVAEAQVCRDRGAQLRAEQLLRIDVGDRRLRPRADRQRQRHGGADAQQQDHRERDFLRHHCPPVVVRPAEARLGRATP